MKNYVQAGDTITLTAPAVVLSGGGILVGTLFGVASNDAAIGDDVEAMTEGVFDLAKTAAQPFSQGAAAYWDNTAKSVTSTASGNKLIGAAAIAAAGADATVRVRLNGISV
jgi:predicted RecA/RadA family phage recombinase